MQKIKRCLAQVCPGCRHLLSQAGMGWDPHTAQLKQQGTAQPKANCKEWLVRLSRGKGLSLQRGSV